MSDDGFVPIGDTLQVRVEEDLVFVRNSKVMTLRDINVLADVYCDVRQKYPTLLVMFDSSRSEGVSREARRSMTAASPSAVVADATAVFGASFAIRTLGNMIDRAVVGLGKPSIGIKFFATEAEARAYLQQERLRVLGDKSFGEK